MSKYVINSEGDLFTVHVPKGGSIPSGYTSIDEGLVIDEDIDGLGLEHLEAVQTPAVQEVHAVDENWSDGESVYYNVNDVPMLTDDNNDPYADPAFEYVAAIEHVPFEAAFYTISKKSSADQSIREAKMDQIRAVRNSLLGEADIEINKLEDAAGDSSAWRTYRQALRDLTEIYKKVDGDWKVSVDSIDVESFEYPTKPSEE
tara:strand:+ start:2624 stop:3229 length:606 start_codon:yes stop_codon:yes gene_type:complete